MEERQRVTRGREAESDQVKREREWPMEERQRVNKGREAESGQWKRGREWPEAESGQKKN